MKYLHTLPRHSALGLSVDNSIEVLQAHSQPQFFNQPLQSATDTLNHTYEADAAILQYVLTDAGGVPLPSIVRLKEGSLQCIDPNQISVSMKWVILDWDLPSKGTLWGDESKPETQEDIHSFIKSHPRLKYAFAYYFSKSGIRVLFELANPLTIKTSQDVLKWKMFYEAFVGQIDISQIGGDLELKCNPFTLNRVPNYRTPEGSLVTSEVYKPATSMAVNVVYPNDDVLNAAPRKSQEKKDYEPLDATEVCNVLWEEPLLKFLRETNFSLCYQDWRGLGTNIASLLGDADGYRVFDQISSWDHQNYNPTAVQSQWPHILRSSEDYGPMTWGKFSMDLTQAYSHVKQTSSLAAQVRRAVTSARSPGQATQSASTSSTVDNSQQVTQLLYTKTVMRNGNPVTNPVKSTSNLLIILTNDNRWVNRIRRNHLGSVDMLADNPITDEDITAIRETINRVYGLAFAKDEVWDFVKLIAHQNEYHPVSDYLEALTWDGVDRVPALAQSLGQKDIFTHTILRKFITSCVVRPLEWLNYTSSVNWKIDTVLILKGSQGKRKSTFFKALCSDEQWFSDSLPSIATERKDASMHMLGKWIVEQAEFEGHVARSSVENMKAFITREREIFRKPYARAEINMRRPSVLVGTTNSSSFLNDPTGDRRFWVLEIPDTTHIDLMWVRQNRDQIWAQAVDMYRKGMTWWLTDAESGLSNQQNAKFRRPDALHEAILEFLNTGPTMANITKNDKYEDGVGFTLKQLVSIGLDKKLSDLRSYETQSITSYLSKMGFVKLRTRVSGQRMYIFRKLKGFQDDEVY